ncbi:MAG TPA: HipA domain-containing protein, partial [Sphaerochaeta sp.]|nr:HipA domain-containing protein [Sphaerochaeta sp.]
PERVRKLTMEDFCQLSGRLTEDKYKGSYEQCGAIIRRYSTQAMLDSTNLFYLILFSFVIGNNDGHLKNFSLYTPEPGHTFLSPAYDLLPVSLVLPQDPKESALTLNGKKSRISRRDFLSLADSLQLPRNVAPRFIDRLHTLQDVFSRIITDSFIPQTYQEQLIALIDQRLRRLRE